MLIDISKNINNNSFIYPDDPKTEIKEFYTFEKDKFRLTTLNIGLHTTTHIDFPSHFLENGKTSSDFSDINYFLGKVLIIDLNDFSKDVKLENNINAIFIKTNNKLDIIHNYNAINSEQLDFLIKNNIKFVGVDFPTVEPEDSNDFHFHKQLLSNDVLIIENLELKNIKDGIYKYYIFPLKIDKSEASLARIAIEMV